jgi:hypothetical protein
MGATTFHTDAYKADTVAEAYETAVRDALYWNGHGGYTGTIAEKGGYAVAEMPAGWSPAEFFECLSDISDDQVPTKLPTLDDVPDYVREDDKQRHLEWLIRSYNSHLKLAAVVPANLLKRYAETYNDKWGAAVAVSTPDGWVFGGWAST